MTPSTRVGPHPRNRFAAGYDLPRLAQACPELGPFLRRAPHGGLSVDFADPAAVKALNRALLLEAYGLRGWELPQGYLVPPVPGRADYLHHLADLLAEGGAPPRGAAVRALDLGTGASLIYPILGHGEYGWSFVGTDLDPGALASAERILAANPALRGAVALRRQADPRRLFAGIVQPGERFDLSLCNPPFFASAREAREAARTKWRKLGRSREGTLRNFGGQGPELWCEGGEAGFLGRMIAESAAFREQVRWFTALVSKSAALPGLQRALRQVAPARVRVVPMGQGQKQSRFLAWSFQA